MQRRAPRGRAAAVGLDRDKVVAAALAQIDEKGFRAFSLRELARNLGVAPAVIYWHVGGGKEDLFSAIAASITATLAEGVDPDAPWQERLRAIFLRYRALVHEHPNVAPLFGAEMKSNGVEGLPWIEAILSALTEAGYRGEDLRDGINILIGGLAGFVTMELAPGPPDDAATWETTFAARTDAIDAATYPLTAAALPHLTNRIFVLRWQNGADVSYDTSFTLLLDTLIAGLAARAPASPTRRTTR